MTDLVAVAHVFHVVPHVLHVFHTVGIGIHIPRVVLHSSVAVHVVLHGLGSVKAKVFHIIMFHNIIANRKIFIFFMIFYKN